MASLIDATVCTANPHKLDEFRELLPGWTLQLLGGPLPPEDGETYVDNALIKARHGFETAGGIVLADDSGIEVAALDGGPGVLTARWAEGRHVERLLAALDGRADREARYVCVLVLLDDTRQLVGRGVLAGRIAEEPAGAEGFGFDPVFVPVGEQLTVAQLGNRWKAAHSHRALAAHALLAQL